MSPTDVGVLVLVTLAGLWDAHTGRIPNGLTYGGWVVGLLFAGLSGGLPGLGNSALGFVVGFVPFFLLYLRGGMGGGDVKLMAAIGAFKGYPFILNAMITAILVGGLLALLIVIWEGKLLRALKFLAMTVGKVFYRGIEPEDIGARTKVPFGVAICLGTFLLLITEWLGYQSPVELFW